MLLIAFLLPTILTVLTMALMVPVLVWMHISAAEAPLQGDHVGSWELGLDTTVRRTRTIRPHHGLTAHHVRRGQGRAMRTPHHVVVQSTPIHTLWDASSVKEHATHMSDGVGDVRGRDPPPPPGLVSGYPPPRSNQNDFWITCIMHIPSKIVKKSPKFRFFQPYTT